MYRFIWAAFFAIVTLSLYSCNKDQEGYQSTKSGLKYKFIKSSDGPKPETGDVMVMDIAYFTPSDSLLFDSRKIRDSFTVVAVEPTFTGGVEEGFRLMSEGDSALFKVSADSLYKITFKTYYPPYLQPGAEIRFRVLLKRIIRKAVLDSLAKEHDVEMRRQEFSRLDAWLEASKLEVMPTQNGAYLNIVEPGTGPFPQPGDSILVRYIGRTLDGTVFEETRKGDPPFTFILGQGMVIPGWEECMPMLNKNTVARMIIPSDLAYGAKEVGVLKPYSTLVFDVEIVEIKGK